MNTYYLSEAQISNIAGICNVTYSKANKAKLTELQVKYNLTFNQDRQTNANMFWLWLVEKLKKDTTLIDHISHNSFAVCLKEGGGLAIKEMMYREIELNYKEDYKFIWNFEPEKVLESIREITRHSQIIISETPKDLLNVDNYQKYFGDNYGIQAADQKAVKATKRVQKFFDELLEGIPNKAGVFEALSAYLQTNDLTALHNKLHQTDNN
jgi:hypothetical protein